MNPSAKPTQKPAASTPSARRSLRGFSFTPKRRRLVLIGLLAVAGLIFLAVTSIGLGKLSNKSHELVDAKLKSETVNDQLNSLAVAKKQVTEFGYFNDLAKTVLPSDKDQAQAVLDIYKLATKAGIAVGNITFPASTLGANSSTSATGSGSTSSAISQAKPVPGIKGLYSLELTITPQTGLDVPASKVTTYAKFLDFLKRIENDRRTAQITQVTIQPETGDSGPSNAVNFTLTINIFMRPQK